VLGSNRIQDALKRAAARTSTDFNALMGAAGSIAAGVHHMGSIDSYIHAHNHDEGIKLVGKIAIIDTILDYERQCKVFIDSTKHPQVFKDEQNVRTSWLDVFMNLLVQRVVVKTNIDDMFKNLAIINFNYDRCLEQYLHHSIQQSLRVSGEDAAELMAKLLIHHPYGSIAKLPWQDKAKGLHLGGDPHSAESVDLEQLSGNIRTFNEEVARSSELDAVKSFLAESRRVVFLGFHFHPQNMDLIALQETNKIGVRHVYASMYGRRPPEKQRIDSQIRGLFQGTSHDVGAHLDINECKELLYSYGTTLAS
jgi:hypothetical protein